jgi:hypothetical protein
LDLPADQSNKVAFVEGLYNYLFRSQDARHKSLTEKEVE